MKMTNKDMIKSLSRFRDAGDKLSSDIHDISFRIIDLITEMEMRDKDGELDNAARGMLMRLRHMTHFLSLCAEDSEKYNQSMQNDYIRVIEALGSVSGDKSNG